LNLPKEWAMLSIDFFAPGYAVYWVAARRRGRGQTQALVCRSPAGCVAGLDSAWMRFFPGLDLSPCFFSPLAEEAARRPPVPISSKDLHLLRRRGEGSSRFLFTALFLGALAGASSGRICAPYLLDFAVTAFPRAFVCSIN
jgi:hypothetical protein